MWCRTYRRWECACLVPETDLQCMARAALRGACVHGAKLARGARWPDSSYKLCCWRCVYVRGQWHGLTKR